MSVPLLASAVMRQSEGMRVAKSEAFDVIVLGAGAGGLTATMVAAAENSRVLLLEKARFLDGTTAISGGMVWLANNSKMVAIGRSDSRSDVETYLAVTIPGPADDPLNTAFRCNVPCHRTSTMARPRCCFGDRTSAARRSCSSTQWGRLLWRPRCPRVAEFLG